MENNTTGKSLKGIAQEELYSHTKSQTVSAAVLPFSGI